MGKLILGRQGLFLISAFADILDQDIEDLRSDGGLALRGMVTKVNTP
jgi:hypothetical protein